MSPEAGYVAADVLALVVFVFLCWVWNGTEDDQ